MEDMPFFTFVSLILMCNGKAPSKEGVEGVKLKESFQKAGIPKDLNITAPKHKLQVNRYCSLSSFFPKKGKLWSNFAFLSLKYVLIKHHHWYVYMKQIIKLDFTFKGCVSFALFFDSWRHTCFEWHIGTSQFTVFGGKKGQILHHW